MRSASTQERLNKSQSLVIFLLEYWETCRYQFKKAEEVVYFEMYGKWENLECLLLIWNWFKYLPTSPRNIWLKPLPVALAAVMIFWSNDHWNIHTWIVLLNVMVTQVIPKRSRRITDGISAGNYSEKHEMRRTDVESDEEFISIFLGYWSGLQNKNNENLTFI